jgi:hypothetical protein
MKDIRHGSIDEGDRRRGRSLRSRLAIPAAMVLTISLAASSRASEVLSLSLDSFKQITATTGSFEVDLSNTSGASATVSDFSIELQLSGLSGVVFTSASMDTTAFPYIFTGVGAGPPLSFTTFPTTEFTGGDSVFAGPPFSVTLPASGPGSTVGLALVTYDTSTASPGTALINFVGAGTSADDGFGDPITLNSSTPAGQIVVPSGVVPEPSTLAILATALPCVLVAGGYFRTRAAIRGRA